MFQYGQVSNALFRIEHRHNDGTWSTLEPADPHEPEDPERGWAKGHIYVCRKCNEVVRIADDAGEDATEAG
jgi:hypothetical protein